MKRHLKTALAVGFFAFRLWANDDRAEFEKNLERLYGMSEKGEHAQAEKLSTELLPKAISLYGKAHLNTIEVTNVLAQSEDRLGKFEKARAHFLEALSFAKEAKLPLSAADNSLSLAFMSEKMGNFVEAEDLYRQVGEDLKPYTIELKSKFDRQIEPKKEISDDYLYAMNIFSAVYYCLGRLNRNVGKYNEAEENMRKALEIRLGLRTSHPQGFNALELMGCYYNLANLYVQRGDFAKAREYFELGFRINESFPPEKRIEDSHPENIENLTDYGLVLYRLGKPKEARERLELNYQISANKLGPRNYITAAPLRALGYMYELAGYSDLALKYHEWAYSIRKETVGAIHTETLYSLGHVGKAHFDLGHYSEAEKAFLEVEQGYAEIKGDQKKFLTGWESGRLQARLAEVEFILGKNPEKILSRFDEALEILEKEYGKNHPFNAEVRNERGVVKAVYSAEAKYDWRLAWKDFSDGTKEHLDWLGRILATGSQREHRVVLARERRGLDQLLSLAEIHAGELSNEESKELYGAVLSWKGASHRIASERKFSAANLNPSKKAEAEKLFSAIQRTRKNLAEVLSAEAGAESSGPLSREYDRLQHEFATLVNDNQFTLLSSAGPDTIAGLLNDKGKNLPPTSLVEFIRYRYLDFGQRRSQSALMWGDYHYGAFVTSSSNDKTLVKFVPLGAAGEIDSAVRGWRELVEKGSLYPREMDERLLTVLWQPVQQAIPAETRALRIAPDGLLWLLPFEAIRLDEQNYLIHRYRVSYLSTGRAAISRNAKNGATGPALILADPDFGPSGRENATPFQPWPGFQSEAKMAIGELSHDGPVDLRLGRDAKKSVLTQLKSPPRELYFISHGRFFGNVNENQATERSHGIVSEPRPKTEVPFDKQGEVLSEQNRARSVLALADANRGPEGLLNALETEGLELSGTELAILSLCESGLGEVVAGQDVSGLRQAFQLAGAKTVVTSLWRVSDDGAEAVMKLFLRNWKRGNGQSGPMSKAQALHEAKLERIRELMPIRFDTNSVAACPVDWAAFTLIGDIQ